MHDLTCKASACPSASMEAVAVGPDGQGTAYKLSGGRTLPEYLSAGTVKSFRRDAQFRRRVELLQEFYFPAHCARVRVAENGQHIAAVGAYPPELKMFDTEQLAVKFSRGFDAEINDFIFLSSDYKKLALLGGDRSVELHGQGGRHCRFRLPRTGRSLAYLGDSATLAVGGSGPDVYRVDLAGGMFEAPIATSLEAGINFVISAEPHLPLLLAGGAEGQVQALDTRDWRAAATFAVSDVGATAGAFADNGRFICVGDAAGVCRVFDIRSARPFAVRDHRNGLPVKDVAVVPRRDFGGEINNGLFAVVSADSRAVKVWAVEDGGGGVSAAFSGAGDNVTPIATLEPDNPVSAPVKLRMSKEAGAINSVCTVPGGSGLIFVAQDNPRVGVYFLPSLGPAPAWCAFLEKLIDEVEAARAGTADASATGGAVFEDHMFVTRQQLEEINGMSLIGTPQLKPYLHGYFMDQKLYARLRTLAKPFEFEEYRKQKREEKLAKQRPMRIEVKQKLPKINRELAKRLQEAAKAKTKVGATKRAKKAQRAEAILEDKRFASLFTDPGFSIESVPL